MGALKVSLYTMLYMVVLQGSRTNANRHDNNICKLNRIKIVLILEHVHDGNNDEDGHNSREEGGNVFQSLLHDYFSPLFEFRLRELII